jgi:predicted  nucleic acid-binding Zn-ribbon protein
MISHLQSQASAQEAANNYRFSELESINSNLQASLNQQKSAFEQEYSKLQSEIKSLNEQLVEAQVHFAFILQTVLKCQLRS